MVLPGFIEFSWLLSGFIGFEWVFNVFLWVSVVGMGFTELYRVFFGFDWILPGSFGFIGGCPWFGWVFLGCYGCSCELNWVLTGFYLAVLGLSLVFPRRGVFNRERPPLSHSKLILERKRRGL